MPFSKEDIFAIIRNIFREKYDNDLYLEKLTIEQIKNTPMISCKIHSTVIFQLHYLKSENILRLIFPTSIVECEKYNINLTMKSYIDKAFVIIDNIEDIKKYKDTLFEAVDNATPKDIACCSHYMECSDKKECVNTNFEIFSHCSYRTKLSRGIIYYGKNKTI